MQARKPATQAKTLKKRKKNIKQQIKLKRPVHKRLLLHPITVFFLLCATVFLVDWTYSAFADTTISAKILAPPLTTGPTITSPPAGTIFVTDAPVSVLGTCPVNSYVTVSRNGSFAGVSVCGADHSFNVQVSLLPGVNTLLATAYNVTDQPSLITGSVDVSLELPASTPTSSSHALTSSNSKTSTLPASSVTPAVSAAPPLILSSAFQWQTFQVNKTFTWTMDVEGGVPPYVVTVDWGDGQTTKYNFAVDPVFSITHAYKAGGYFVIKAHSVDAKGAQQIMQLAALIDTPGKASSFLQHATTSSGDGMAAIASRTQFFVASKNWLLIAWPSLAVVILMMFSFWLGEAQDKRLMLAHVKPSRHR